MLVLKIIEYARNRAKEVACGAETPRLAAQLIQKYGRGVADAVAVIYDSPQAASPIFRARDQETARINPDAGYDWKRWVGWPADIVIH